MTIVANPPQASQGGVMGLEGHFTWNGDIVLNDRAEQGTRVILDSVPGLQALAEIEDLRDMGTGHMGEIARFSVRRGKTVTPTGRVQSTSMAGMRQRVSQIGGAFAQTAEGQMVITQPRKPDSPSRFLKARCLSFDPGDEIFSEEAVWPYQQPFVIGLRMGDPRLYDLAEVALNTAPIAVSLGVSPPLTPPFTTFTSTAAGSAILVNAGNAESDPVIDIYGPVTNPILENTTIGRKLVFSAAGGITLTASTFLRVDFGSRRVLLNGQSDFRVKLDFLQSDWWNAGVPGLQPGNNTIRLRGENLADPAHAHISYHPAFWS